MFNIHADKKEVRIGSEILEEVSKYVYLGQEIGPDGNQTQEIKRKMQAGWVAFSRHEDILREKKHTKLFKKETIQPMHPTGHDIWKRNMVLKQGNGKENTNYTKKHGKDDAWIYQERS